MKTIKLIGSSPTEKGKHSIEVIDGYKFSSKLHSHKAIVDKNKNLYIKKLFTDGLILIDTVAIFKEKIKAVLSFDSHMVAMLFHNKGNTKITSKEDRSSIFTELQNRTHNIKVINANTIHILFEPDNMIDSFIVFLSKDFFLKLMPKTDDMHNDLVYAVENGISASFSKNDLPLNQEMRRIIENVRNCIRKGFFHRLCIEIKVTELLMLQLEQFYLLNSKKNFNRGINKLDQERLDSAKLFLEENFHAPPTIKKLSLMVGMNEAKLKSYFKESYNSTIHSYIVKLRMEMAYQLISKQNLLLKEVAMIVGYQNPSHFSSAFKKFYGFVPRNIIS